MRGHIQGGSIQSEDNYRSLNVLQRSRVDTPIASLGRLGYIVAVFVMAWSGVSTVQADKPTLPVDVRLDFTESVETGQPATLVVTVSSRVPLTSGVISIDLPPELSQQPSVVLWRGDLNVPGTFDVSHTIAALPVGQYEFKATFMFEMPSSRTAGVTARLVVEAAQHEVRTSPVSHRQIQRERLKDEVDALGLQGMSIDGIRQIDPELAERIEALNRLPALEQSSATRNLSANTISPAAVDVPTAAHAAQADLGAQAPANQAQEQQLIQLTAVPRIDARDHAGQEGMPQDHRLNAPLPADDGPEPTDVTTESAIDASSETPDSEVLDRSDGVYTEPKEDTTECSIIVEDSAPDANSLTDPQDERATNSPSATLPVAIAITSEDERLAVTELGIRAEKLGITLAYAAADVRDELDERGLRWWVYDFPQDRSESGGWQVVLTEHTVRAQVTAKTEQHVLLAHSLGVVDVQMPARPTITDIDESTLETLRRSGLAVQVLAGRVAKIVARETCEQQVDEDSLSSDDSDGADDRKGDPPREDSCYGGCDCCWPDSDICVPDQGGASAYVPVTCAPPGATITQVRVACKLQDPGSLGGCDDTEMWCSDHEIQVNNQQHSYGSGYTLWDHYGSETDGGYDDDSANDRDIELDRYVSSFFDGDNANQTWYLDVWDHASGDTAEIDYFEIWVYYETPNQPPDADYDTWWPSTIYAGQTYTIRTDHWDDDGRSDVDLCVAKLGIDCSSDIRIQYDPDNDSYSVTAGSSLITLNSASKSTITNGWRITWSVTLKWTWSAADDGNNLDPIAGTYDRDGEYVGWCWDNNYDYENDARITNVSYDTTPPYNTSFTVTGYVDYEGVTSPTPPDVFDICIDPDWSSSNWCDYSLSSSGQFSISLPAVGNCNTHYFDIDFSAYPSGAGHPSSNNFPVYPEGCCDAPATPSSCTSSIGSPPNGPEHHLDLSCSTVSGADGYDFDYSYNGSTWYDLEESPTYSWDVNAGDQPNVGIYFRVRAYACSPRLYSGWRYCSPYPIYTACDDPAAPDVGNPTTTSLDVTLVTESPVPNPSSTMYSIRCTTTSTYVQADGSLGGTEVFRTRSAWGTVTVTGLDPDTTYTFYAKAKNGDGDVRHNSSNTGSGTTQQAYVTVSGYMRFHDRNGYLHPIRYATVEVWDDDPVIDDRIGLGATNQDGWYSITVENDESNGIDIYVKVLTEGIGYGFPPSASNIALLRDDIFHTPYFLQSSTYENYLNSTLTVSMSASNSGDNAGAFDVFASCVEGFLIAYYACGVDMDRVMVYWPAFATNHILGVINVGQEFRYDRDLILHEYGHFVADANGFADAITFPWPLWAGHSLFGDWRDITITDPDARQGAFAEAWATFFSIAGQRERPSARSLWDPVFGDDTIEPHDEYIRGAADESYYSYVYESLEHFSGRPTMDPGQYCEAAIIGALWDIYDDHDDDVYDNGDMWAAGLDEIWSTCDSYNSDDTIEFWNHWFNQYAHNREMTDIFLNCYMDFIAQYPTGPVPQDGAVDQSVSVDLNWNDASHATSYDVYFGTDPTPDAGEFQGNTTSSNWTLGPLNENTTYYWVIVARDAHAEAWGAVWSFTTTCSLPSQAASPSPADGATDVSTDADLDWGNAYGATSYDVYFGTDPTPDAGEFQGNTTSSNWTLGPLNESTTYYWQIDSKNACGTTTGQVWSFTTTCSLPSQAASPSPANGATDVSTDADLDWGNAYGATSYDVYFGTDPTPDAGEFQGNTTSSSWTLGPLSENTTYYWQIDSKNACGTTTGQVWSFTTATGVFTLTVNIQGLGTVQLDPSGGQYPPGTTVELTPQPASGWHFHHWQGIGPFSCEAPAQVLMDADKTVTAVFEETDFWTDYTAPSCEVYPNSPASNEQFAITVGGEWPNNCVPDVLDVSLDGQDIYLDVTENHDASGCMQMITQWSLSEALGPLPIGTYSVWVTRFNCPGNAVTLPTNCLTFDVQEATSPTVVSTTPADDSIHYKSCPLDTIGIAFSEPVRGAGGVPLAVTDFKVDGSSDAIVGVSYDDELYEVTLTIAPLSDRTWHTVMVDGAIEDLAGTKLDGNTTGGVPGTDHYWIDIGVQCGDFQQDEDVDVIDRTQFLAAWTNGDPTADHQCDGDVDVIDRTQFLACWTDNEGTDIGPPPSH